MRNEARADDEDPWAAEHALAPFAPPSVRSIVGARESDPEMEAPWAAPDGSPSAAAEDESLPDNEAAVGTAADEAEDEEETYEIDGFSEAAESEVDEFHDEARPLSSTRCRCARCRSAEVGEDETSVDGESDPERAAQSELEFGGAAFEAYVERNEVVPQWSEMPVPASVFEEHEDEDEAENAPVDAFEDEEGEIGAYEAPDAALASGLSPIARRTKLHPGKGKRRAPWDANVYGLVVHTTGGTLPGKARKAGTPPDEYAAQYYTRSGGTHYVNGWNGVDGGQLHQVMNDRHVAWGVGKNKAEPAKDQWRSNDAGRFERDLPAAVVRLWRARWPGIKDSLSLLPVRSSANLTYVHVECVPCVYYRNGDGPLVTDPAAPAMRAGLRFTRAQHETVARLAWDLASRHGWPRGQAWWKTPRLLGHEDITPLSRHDRNGGWDPGGLRDAPYFDWPFVYAYLERLAGGAVTNPPSPAPSGSTQPAFSVGALLGSLSDRFRDLIRAGKEVVAVTEAVGSGQKDVNVLANLVFFARHPELNGRKLRPDERALAQEWLQIRDAVVRPVLAGSQPRSTADAARGAASVPRPAPAAASGTPKVAPRAAPSGDVVKRVATYSALVDAAARKYGVDAALIKGVIAAESGGNASLVAKSGYTGLMQAGTTPAQKDPQTSIETGTKKLRDFRKSMESLMKARGARYDALPETERLQLLALAYNAGAVTVAKALQYATDAGNPAQWFAAEHYKRALLFTGAYSLKQASSSCPPALSPAEVEARMQEARRIWIQHSAKHRLRSMKGAKKSWRDLSDPGSWPAVSATLPQFLVCAIDFKHRNSPKYVAKILAYRDRFRSM